MARSLCSLAGSQQSGKARKRPSRMLYHLFDPQDRPQASPIATRALDEPLFSAADLHVRRLRADVDDGLNRR